MSLGTPQAQALDQAVTAFAASDSRAAQHGELLDQVIRTTGDLDANFLSDLLRLLPADMTAEDSDGYTVLSYEGHELLQRMHLLEAFDGARYVQIFRSNAAETSN